MKRALITLGVQEGHSVATCNKLHNVCCTGGCPSRKEHAHVHGKETPHTSRRKQVAPDTWGDTIFFRQHGFFLKPSCRTLCWPSGIPLQVVCHSRENSGIRVSCSWVDLQRVVLFFIQFPCFWFEQSVRNLRLWLTAKGKHWWSKKRRGCCGTQLHGARQQQLQCQSIFRHPWKWAGRPWSVPWF